MEAWTDLYLELADRISNKIPEIAWVDLWQGQAGTLTGDLPFSTPAVFIGFTINSCEDLSLLIQACDMQVDFYLLIAPSEDPGAEPGGRSAIDDLRLLTKLHTCFHGVSGINFQTMRRVDMRREDQGGAENLYRISFNCNVEDASPQKEFDEHTVTGIVIKREETERLSTTDDEPLFHLPK